MTNATIAAKENVIDFSKPSNFGICADTKKKQNKKTPAVDHTSVDITSEKPKIKPKKPHKECKDKIFPMKTSSKRKNNS